MDQATWDGFVTYLIHQRIVDYGYIAAQAIVFYDYILTLEREITLVWFAPMSYTGVLYFLVKYLPIIPLSLEIPIRYVIGTSMKSCAWQIPMATWILVIGVLLAEFVLVIRTWAVWHRDRKIGIGLVILVIGMICAGAIVEAKYSESVIMLPPPYPEFQGCNSTGDNNVLKIDFIILACADSVVCFLMALSAFKTYKTGSSSELSAVIHRDGILFYIYLLAFTIMNIIIMSFLPTDMRQIITPVCCSMYSVLTSRIVLNIRGVARRSSGVPTELHGYQPTQTLLPLEFRSGGIQSTIIDGTVDQHIAYVSGNQSPTERGD
jgi:hypothetical protein